MIKNLKKEIKKYIEKNPEIKKAQEDQKKISQIEKSIPQKLLKGITEITIENKTLKIKTTSPSWRQETLFFKKEIIEKINKKSRDYTIEKIIIL